jgi:hypothetical protein
MNSDFKRICKMVIFCLLLSKISHSQVQNDIVMEQIIESMAQNFSEDHDYSEIIERLNHYRKTPININEATKEQLEDLFFISPIQLNAILNHREANGLFVDVLELQSVNGLDIQTIRWLLNFIVVLRPGDFRTLSFKNVILKSEHDLMLRFGQILEKQSGFSSSDKNEAGTYSGSPMRMFARYRYNYSDFLFASVNMEKDAGEPFSFKNGLKGFDFYSANLSYQGKGQIRKIIVGDYALQFGQGLSMWAGAGFGKGANLGSIARRDVGLRPYSSVNESFFLRGIAGTFEWRKFLISPFYSGRRIDAGISDFQISSLQLSGLHRTKTEIFNKNAISQRAYGANLQYKDEDLTIGLTGFQTRFSIPFAKGNTLYQQ